VFLEHTVTDKCAHDREYKDLSLGLKKWNECYWKSAVGASRYKGGRVSIFREHIRRTVIQRTASCMSTAIIRGVVRCFTLIFEGDEEPGLSMLMSAGSGRAEI
jgi:hypothetical protein